MGVRKRVEYVCDVTGEVVEKSGLQKVRVSVPSKDRRLKTWEGDIATHVLESMTAMELVEKAKGQKPNARREREKNEDQAQPDPPEQQDDTEKAQEEEQSDLLGPDEQPF